MQWYPCLSQLEILLEIGEEQIYRGESGGKEISLNQSMQSICQDRSCTPKPNFTAGVGLADLFSHFLGS